jgi:hypothetical protein
MGEPEAADECIRLVTIAAEIGRLVDLLKLHVPKASRLDNLPNLIAICECERSWCASRWLRKLSARGHRVLERSGPLQSLPRVGIMHRWEPIAPCTALAH